MYTITKEWIESEVTWEKANDDTEWEMLDPDTKYFNPNTDDTVSNPGGCDYDRKPVEIVDYVDANSWENYNVTEVIKQAVNNGKSFHGFMIKQFLEPAEEAWEINTSAKGIDGRLYWSSEYDSLDLRPKLTVTYTSTSIGNPVFSEIKEDISLINRRSFISVYISFVSNYNLSVYNLQGKRVLTLNDCMTKRIDLPVNNLSSGVHSLTIQNEQTTISKRFTFIR